MSAAYGLYGHIRANRTRSAILIAGLFFLVYLLVFAFALLLNGLALGGEDFETILSASLAQFVFLLPWATIAAGLWVFAGYRFHQWMIDKSTGARDVTRNEEPDLYNMLENLCIARGIPMPSLQVIESDVLNAYASGMNDKQYRIAVTRGLMNALDPGEMEAVLAHELTHIRNGDVRLMVVAVVIAGVVTLVGELFFRSLRYMNLRSSSSSSSGGKKGGGGAIIAILLAAVIIAIAWFLSLVIRFALSRSREYLADAGAVELTKNPDAMISALRKIEGRSEMPNVPSGIMEMCIDNKRNSFADLFATHPTIERRVRKLVEVAGGEDTPAAAPPAA